MDDQDVVPDGGRHGCGKCFTSFATPEQLQKHCVTCFGDSADNVQSSVLSESTHEDLPMDNSFSITIDEEDDVEQGDSKKQASLSTFETLSHPAFDSIMARNNEPGGRCIRIIAGKKIMQCTICLKTFTNYNSFKRHRRMHVSGAAFRCNLCNRNFFRRYLWKNHMERNHGKVYDDDHPNTDSKLECDSNESYDFGQGSPLKRPINCSLCKSNFKTNAALTEHLKTKHNIRQVAFPVSIDGKSSDEEMEVDENANVKKFTVNSENPSDDWERPSSEGVPESISERYDLPSNHSSPGPLSDIKGSIPSLNKLVMNVDSLDFENGVTDPRKKQPSYSCPECDRNFNDEFDLQIHAMKTHKQKSFRCLFCFVSFGEQDLLKAHLESHRGNENYACHICKYEASNCNDLKIHFEAAHETTQGNSSDSFEEDEDQEIGDVSDVIVVNPLPSDDQSINKVNQTSEQNSNAKVFSCCVCGDKFDQKELFLRHMKTHMYLFCESCGRQFINQNEMLKHQTKCTFASNRSCYICQLPFDSVLKLKYHVFMHLSETNNVSNFSIHRLFHQKSTNEASKRVDSLLRNKGLLPVTKEKLGENLKEFNADYGSKVSFSKSHVPSSGNHSAISVTLTPMDRSLKEAMKNASRAHACLQCGKDFGRQELLQRHMIRDHVFKKNSTSNVKYDGNKSSGGKSIIPKQASENPILQSAISEEKDGDRKTGTPPLMMPSPNDLREKMNSVLLPLESRETTSLLNRNVKTATFSCRHCSKSFSILAALNQHLSEHFVPHFCEFCAMPFSEKSEMLTHKNGVHGRAQRYYCYTCCTNVANSAELKKHILLCRGPPVPEAPASTPTSVLSPQSFGTYKECKICHKKFVNEKRLMNHTCVGNTDGAWMCEICNISFPQSSHLASHQQQAHKSDEVYRCDVCGLSGHKEFIITHMITIHMTKVSAAMNNANSGQQSSLTITPIASAVTKPSKVLNIDQVTPRSNVHTKDSVFVAPRNPNEIQITYKQQPAVGNRTIDLESKTIPSSARDLCVICNKSFPSSEFPEHMFREHCGGVKVVSSNEKSSSSSKPAANEDRKNVIEIMSKEEPKAEMSIQIVL